MNTSYDRLGMSCKYMHSSIQWSEVAAGNMMSWRTLHHNASATCYDQDGGKLSLSLRSFVTEGCHVASQLSPGYLTAAELATAAW